MSVRSADTQTSRWLASFHEGQKTLSAWLFLMLVLAASRIVYLLALRSSWPVDYTFGDLVRVFGRGSRFDCVTATYLCGLPLLLGSLAAFSARLAHWAQCARLVAVALFVTAAPAVLLGAIGYYQEYQDQLNTWVFELFFEDAWPILCVMQSEYWLVQKLIFSAVTTFALWRVYRHFFELPWVADAMAVRLATGQGRLVVPLAFALAFVVGSRGSLESRPLQQADAGVTGNRFFNKATLNGFYALNIAAADRLDDLKSRSPFPPLAESEVAEAAELVFHADGESKDGAASSTADRAADNPLYRIAPGPRSNHPPRQIFVLIMESYDAWPFLERYRSLGLVENGRRLAKNGLHVQSFLPSANHSLNTYLALTTGLHYTSRFLQREYPTSLPHIFARLGYRPRLFVGDSATWQHMEEMSALEGFAEFYAAASIAKQVSYSKPRVSDQELFEFVETHVSRDTPSINVIRTTSNHGPYEIDLDKEGCRIPALPDDLAAMCNKDRGALLSHLGHLKYSDKCLGRFIERMEAQFPEALFVITGDHYGRNFLNTQPSDFEGTCVPLILYGKQALAGIELPEGVVGSHLDLTPTLVSFVAPAGFRYASLGSDMLAPRREYLGISESHLIGADFIVDFSNVPTIEALPWADPDSASVQQATMSLPRLARAFQSLQGLSSWLDSQTEQASLRDRAPETRR